MTKDLLNDLDKMETAPTQVVPGSQLGLSQATQKRRQRLDMENRLAPASRTSLASVPPGTGSSPASKAMRVTGLVGSGPLKEKENAPQKGAQFSSEQKDWLQLAVKDSLIAFGTAVDQQLDTIRGSIKEVADAVEQDATKVDEALTIVEKKFQEMDVKIDTLEQDNVNLKAELAQMKIRQDTTDAAVASSSSNGQHSAIPPTVPLCPSQQAANVTPMAQADSMAEKQTIRSQGLVRFGSLGWNESPEELVRRTQQVIQQCNFAPGMFTSLQSSRRDGGSTVDAVMLTPIELERAKSAVRCAGIKFGNDPATPSVWLDLRKTREELRPARLTHRAHEYVEHLENDNQDASGNDRKCQATKSLQKKTVALVHEGNEIEVGKVYGRTFHWTAFAKSRYSNEELHQGSAFVNDM